MTGFRVCTQLGSYFGAAVCAVDLNSDGLSDLLVGAPMESTIREEGRVYVYINSGSVSIFSSKYIVPQLFSYNKLKDFFSHIIQDIGRTTLEAW